MEKAKRKENMMKLTLLALSLAAPGAIVPEQAVAQSTPQRGAALMQAGGEWAIGRWEGSVFSIGTPSGTAGLQSSPRTLIVQKSADGSATCSFFVSGDPVAPTKQCVIKVDGISLVTGASADVELSRSGPDSLQGTLRWTHAVVGRSAGMAGAQVSMQRVR
jgi:hypothetical protein